MAGAIAAGLDNNKCVAGTGGYTTVRGYCNPNPSTTLETMQDAIEDGNPIINVSIQGFEFDDDTQEARTLVRNAFEDAVDRGSVVTFAVNARNAIHLTGIPGVLLVGFGYESGAYLPYERGGVADEGIEFILPAYKAFTTHGPDSCKTNDAGSSIGAAYLAGIVALMLDVNNCLTPPAIEEILWNTSQDVPNRECCYPTYFVEGKSKVNAYQAVLGAQNYNGEPQLVVSSGDVHTITDEVLRYNDIRVETGGVLEINSSSISIEGNASGPYQNGRIEVERGAKLIVRNSTLTSSATSGLCASSEWSGIRVHGNTNLEQPNMYDANGILQVNTPLAANEAGVVILLQETVIENAQTAVAASVPGYPYPEQVARWGGLIIADHVIFRNNSRAAHFNRYPRPFSGNTFTDKSTFNDCFFLTEDPEDDRSLGITVWDTEGIKVTKSTFQNIGRESILTIDGSYVAEDGNTFINAIERTNHRHLSTMATYPYGSSTRVGSDDGALLPNEFYTIDKDDVFVFSEGSDARNGTQIVGNEFYFTGPQSDRNGAPAGIKILGAHTYTVMDNLFNSCRQPITLVGQPVSFVAQNLIFCPLASQKITSVATAMQVIFRLASDQNIFVFS
jgi:hypothetical protein